MEATGLRYLLLEAGSLVCAVRLEQVHELLEPRPLSPAPGAPDWCAGVLATQHGVVMVADLAAWLGGERVGQAEKIVVLDRSVGGLALLVRELLGIVILHEYPADSGNLNLQEGPALILDAASLVDEMAASLV